MRGPFLASPPLPPMAWRRECGDCWTIYGQVLVTLSEPPPKHRDHYTCPECGSSRQTVFVLDLKEAP